MNYILLMIAVVTATIQSVFMKEYGKKNTNGPITYTMMSCFFAVCVFVVSSGFKFEFNSGVLLYSFFFALCFAAAFLGLTIAVSCGPLSITSLINSYSLLVPTFYGILFLNEKIRLTMIVGFAFLVVSLFLINYVKGGKKEKISSKWLIAMAVSFVGNGMCSTVQKMQQIAFNKAYKDEFMIMALVMCTLALLVIALIKEKGQLVLSIKKGWYFAFSGGVANGITNLLTIVLGNLIPLSLMFPVISAGGIIIASALSIYVYKEKLRKLQIVGVLLGVCAIVFLNI